MVGVNAFNPTGEAEASRQISEFKASLVYIAVPGQPRLYRKNLSLKTKINNQTNKRSLEVHLKDNLDILNGNHYNYSKYRH